MFSQFNIKNLGNIEGFDLNKFWEYEDKLSTNNLEFNGSTLPIFMYKLDYLRLGGWDENYENGMVADWDFFLKCNLSNMNMIRTYNCHFYHFASDRRPCGHRVVLCNCCRIQLRPCECTEVGSS